MEHLIYKYCKMSRNLENIIGESKRKLEQKLVSIVYYWVDQAKSRWEIKMKNEPSLLV